MLNKQMHAAMLRKAVWSHLRINTASMTEVSVFCIPALSATTTDSAYEQSKSSTRCTGHCMQLTVQLSSHKVHAVEVPVTEDRLDDLATCGIVLMCCTIKRAQLCCKAPHCVLTYSRARTHLLTCRCLPHGKMHIFLQQCSSKLLYSHCLYAADSPTLGTNATCRGPLSESTCALTIEQCAYKITDLAHTVCCAAYDAE
jgi:hypothetical protein